MTAMGDTRGTLKILVERGAITLPICDPQYALPTGDEAPVTKHVFDLTETATHSLVANRLRSLADQFERGEIELAYDEWHTPTVVVDPVDVVVDLMEKRDHVELVIQIRWPLGA